ncbi:ABC transporter permease subunit [Microbacterium sp.]|uniref:ABC transporter permease subunit n=1 Tax=Microbacterium sp. TaxID=51671 RepID=UPI0039E588B5
MNPRPALVAASSRVVTIVGVVFLLSIIPLLSGRDQAVSIFRARSAEGEITEEALEAIRREIGLDAGPFGSFTTWFGGVLRGDLGVSWVARKPVALDLVTTLGTSLTLMLASFGVAVVLAALLTVPTFRRGLAGRPARTGGGAAAAFTALPDFLLASVLLIVFAVWLGWFPPYGWRGPQYVVLPALAMGIPAGGFLGRMLSDALADTFAEKWIATWQVAGSSNARIVLAALRRTLPGIAAPLSLVLVSITASAVVVEQVYAIPGIGRTTIGAAQAQDLPTLQGGVLLLMLLAVAFGVGVTLLRVALLGPALRSSSLPAPVPRAPSSASALILPAAMLVLLVVLIVAGLPRDPYALDFTRLQAPDWTLPFGADASGRDVLARVSHGALSTLGTGVVVMLACLALSLVVGLFPNAAAGPIEITNAAPPILAGLIVAAIMGPSAVGAAIAVAAVSWAPLASHTAALVAEAKAQPHIAIAPVLGVGRVRLLFHYVLPGVIGPVFRHACLRLPGICLALAALGFLGLGPQPPASDWGLVLSEGLPYVERAPFLVALPAAALIALGVFAVSLSNVTLRRRTGRTAPDAVATAHDPAHRTPVH